MRTSGLSNWRSSSRSALRRGASSTLFGPTTASSSAARSAVRPLIPLPILLPEQMDPCSSSWRHSPYRSKGAPHCGVAHRSGDVTLIARFRTERRSSRHGLLQINPSVCNTLVAWNLIAAVEMFPACPENKKHELMKDLSRSAHLTARHHCMASACATFCFTEMKLSGLTEIELIPHFTRNTANSG